VSPTTLLARSLAWFAATFTKMCPCPQLEVRIEGKALERGAVLEADRGRRAIRGPCRDRGHHAPRAALRGGEERERHKGRARRATSSEGGPRRGASANPCRRFPRKCSFRAQRVLPRILPQS